MGVDLDTVEALLRRRAREYGLLECRRLLLNADIANLRMIEEIQRSPFPEKLSVDVERRREVVQQQLKEVEREMGDLVTLVARVARNKTDAGE